MPLRCSSCARKIDWPPTCYSAPAPCYDLGIPDDQFPSRVQRTPDQCVVDNQHFFIRGHIEIPILGSTDPLAWSVWCSLSEDSFRHITTRWHDADRANDPPRFGWLQTHIPGYPQTIPTKTMVHTREPGRVPYIEVDPAHPLGQEQLSGITPARLEELAHLVLGDEPPKCYDCAARPR